jgi:hypothetical protein
LHCPEDCLFYNAILLGFVLTVRNNIISNTKSFSGGGGRYRMNNELSGTYSFVLQNNCFCGNAGSDYKDMQASFIRHKGRSVVC